MGLLLAAIATAATFVLPTPAATSRELAVVRQTPQLLYTSPPGSTIKAFAQDRQTIAWFAPSTTKCNTVHLLSLTTGGQVLLPNQSPGMRNITCRWNVTPPPQLALAGSDALWTLHGTYGRLPFDYLVWAGLTDKTDRLEWRIQELTHASGGAGLWFGGSSGSSDDASGTLLVYGETAVDYVDEVACLSGGSCEMKIAGGGGVYRVADRRATLVPDTRSAIEVAVSGSTVAYVPAATVDARGRPVAAASSPVELVDATTGAVSATATTQGPPVAIALAPHVLTTLEQTATGYRIAWYSAATGTQTGSVNVPATTAPELSANDQVAAFRIGRFIHVLTFATGHSTTVAESVGDPIGLSLDGNRLAWAENVKGRGRIRSVTVRG